MVNSTNQRTVTIYALVDPRDGHVRYVGWAFDVHTRYLAHVRDGGDGPRGKYTHKANWVRSLRREGLRPRVGVLQSDIPEEHFAEAEQHWIAMLRGLGANLTNASDGGEGVLNPTPETRAKMSASAKNKPPMSAETRAKLSAGARGRKLRPRRPEHSAAISRAHMGRKASEESKAKRRGKHRSAETRAKMAEAHRALPPEHWDYLRGKAMSPEHRAKIGAALRGRTRIQYPPDDELERMLDGRSLASVARDLGINNAALHQHVKKMRARREAAPPE